MTEEIAKFNIEKQEAKRDIVNVAGNYIIHNPITHEPVYIPSIQSVLRKEESSEGDFFKKEPEWVDYEQGFIVERKEVDEIIRKMENNKVQLVMGAPASGKSIILKNVGFKLANENKKVYAVELKKHPEDEAKFFFDNIPKIVDESTIFIIDDAHLNISECEKLIRNFKRGKGKLIIGSRETKEIIEGEPTKSSEFEHISKTAIRIKAEDVTEEMIRIFLKNQYNLDEDRIRTISSSLWNFKKDLWNLSWALKVYDLNNHFVDENKIYKNIKKRIENINAENIFLPLSIFFRYEIPIERKFLKKQMGIEKSIIDDLIKIQEIIEIEEIKKPTMLSLHHSSIADLYFKTYQNYPSFGEEIKEKILNQEDKEDLEYCSFYRYMTTTDPRNSVNVIIYLGRDLENMKGGKTLLKNFIEEEKIQESIVNGIDKEEEIGKVGRCLTITARANEEIASKLVYSIDIVGLSAKMAIQDASANGACLAGISNANKEFGIKLVNNVVSKVDVEEDIDKIAWCVSNIDEASKKLSMKLVHSIDIPALSLKINKEEDIEKVGFCVLDIARSSEEVGLKLINRIDISALASKIDKEQDIRVVGVCILGITYASKEVAMKLLEIIDINILSSKIDKEDDIDKVEYCIAAISLVRRKLAMKLLEISLSHLNPILKEKLQKRVHFLNNAERAC